MVLSQNANQFAKTSKAYGYTIYDPLNRITEVGELATSADVSSIYTGRAVDDQKLTEFRENGVRTEVGVILI